MSNLKEKAKLNRKKLLSAAVITVCGIAGLGYACMTNSPKESITVADKGKYILSDTGSREITNEMYDFNKVSSHKIIQSAVSLEESDSIKSLGNNIYMVPNDYTDENITETYSDDVITVCGNAADTEIKDEYDSQESALKKYLDGENTTGNDLRVAVIDSGISGYGTDNRILKGVNFSATGGDDFSDDNGHGNAMAGIISGMTADNVDLMPVKVIDSSGRGTVASLYKGIEYAVEQDVDVINLSVATASSDSGLIKKAVKDAVDAGITVVAAAGNYETIASNDNGDWYCQNGKVNFDANGVLETPQGWYYVQGGKVQKGKESVENNSQGWWYIGTDGRVNCNKNTVAGNSNSWWVIRNGKVDFNYNGIASNDNGDWYCQDGKVNFDANGVLYALGNWYYIQDGKVQKGSETVQGNSCGWWYIGTDGKVDFNHEGIASNENGTWYIRNGQVSFSDNFIYTDKYGCRWKVENSRATRL